MKRIHAKRLTIILYICLLFTMPVMVYLQINNEVLLSIILVGMMFVISMVMFWLSTKEHEADEAKMKEKRFLN
ncbi:hypothetical protein GK047_04905 [Paenibacillus sp. SYP-B3998]|uniref:Uncharacterized protein n=1 Tax=Paenibacillus sp. SYP-B3998 TaxID=2678564 RepID=A0A6G3ZTA9_9BACL|nr:hypothetical protein [Paenibacillus sp. SYP-B3998]NEW05355.1 hypothetical protein [Paenibacillus sp. SYP-B3998]